MKKTDELTLCGAPVFEQTNDELNRDSKIPIFIFLAAVYEIVVFVVFAVFAF